MEKCRKCKAPLSGFIYKTVGRLFGVKKSEKDPTLCNKCAAQEESPAPVSAEPEVDSSQGDQAEEETQE